MEYLSIVFVCSLLLGIGIILLKLPFFGLANTTVGMLNVILENQVEDAVKQKILIKNLGRLLKAFAIILLAIAAVLFASALPLLVYAGFSTETLAGFDYSSWKFFLALTVGSLLPFIILPLTTKKEEAYSDFSKLLHRMILNNYNISKALFFFEWKSIKKKVKGHKDDFVIISGLARCGTTGLTTLLYQSNKFHSLSYANLPFLLSPNLWKKVYKPKDDNLTERAHGDKVLFGFNTIEALEEFFFKAFLNDSFIGETTLTEHKIDEKVNDHYLNYQNMVKNLSDSDTTYLSKNNNFLLRYKSIREHNPSFKALFIFREPVKHAYSLMKQHIKFSEMQSEDPFVREYMDWLGHHEFGLSQKPFDFGSNYQFKYESKDTINHWLEVWINYYQHLQQFTSDEHLYLIDYKDFLEEPKGLLKSISTAINTEIVVPEIEPFINNNSFKGDVDSNLIQSANIIYDKLRSDRLKPS